MILFILALLLLGGLIGAAGMKRLGRLSRRITGPWRPGVSLLALLAVLGAGALVVRGAALEGVLLLVLGLGLAITARRRAPSRSQAGRQTPPSRMSQDEARRMLGVGPAADRTEIEAAFRRLMQRAHPDLGGSSGLAAQLNAAREALLH